MTSMQLLVAVLAVLIGSGGVGGTVGVIVVKRMNRSVDNANAEAASAGAEQSRATARKDDVDTLRNIITEVRQSEAMKAARIDALEQRIDKLEERERHMLTRAAVHESWDRLAFNFIAQHNPDFEPPPPLTGGDRDLHL